jgi:hypothetical protein
MTNYVLAYSGGSMPGSEQEQADFMAAWGTWFGTLGAAVVDAGTAFRGSASVASDGAVTEGGSSHLSGYSIIQAEGLSAATTLVKGCPVLSRGGRVEVYEAPPM